MKLLRALAPLILLAFAPMARAAPVPYVTGPTGTYTEAVNDAIANVNATLPSTSPTTACTGTTTATCQGIRVQPSYTGLTTAATATSAAQTVTDASVATGSQIICMVNGYAGTGNPMDTNVIPGAGSFTYQIQNTAASGSLNATVVSVCFVYN